MRRGEQWLLRSPLPSHGCTSLAAEIAVRAFLHVDGQLRADAFALAAGNAEPLQLFRRSGCLRQRMAGGDRFSAAATSSVDDRHSIFIVLTKLSSSTLGKALEETQNAESP